MWFNGRIVLLLLFGGGKKRNFVADSGVTLHALTARSAIGPETTGKLCAGLRDLDRDAGPPGDCAAWLWRARMAHCSLLLAPAPQYRRSNRWT
jgi:hypothetical protein